jgi:hypothetical protein
MHVAPRPSEAIGSPLHHSGIASSITLSDEHPLSLEHCAQDELSIVHPIRFNERGKASFLFSRRDRRIAQIKPEPGCISVSVRPPRVFSFGG